MSEVVKLIKESTIRDIAEAIKEKEGSVNQIPVVEMGNRIRAIAGALAEINGYSYVCGTMSFEEDQISDVKIDHEDVGDTKIILVWCENLIAEEVAYKAIAFYIPSSVGTTRWFNSGAIIVNGAAAGAGQGQLSFGSSATQAEHGVYITDNTQFRIGAGSGNGCRLLAGKTYHWIVIGGGVT